MMVPKINLHMKQSTRQLHMGESGIGENLRVVVTEALPIESTLLCEL